MNSRPSKVTIRLLQAVGDWKEGVVIAVAEDRARRLIRTGYAVEVKPRPAMKETREE